MTDPREVVPTLPRPLLGRFWAAAAMVAAAIGGGYLWLDSFWPPAGRWALLALAVAGVGLLLLRRHLDANVRPGEVEILPTLGFGNGLTLTRGLLLAALTGFLAAPPPQGWLAWLPVILYTIAAILDIFDGLAARLANHATRLGELLDLEYDSYGVGLLVLLAIHFGQVGWWYLILALVRYGFVLGIWWRRRQGQPVFDLPPSRYRRLVAGYNMGFLTAVLWPILTPPAATLGAVVYIVPLLGLFLRDWLVVSGRLDPFSAIYQTWRARLVSFAAGWLPLALRGVIAITMFTSGLVPPFGEGRRLLTGLIAGWGWPSPWPSAVGTALPWLGLICLVAVVLGVWARWLALVAIFPAGLALVAAGITPGQADLAFLGAALCYITLFNSGRLSLRRPPEEYMFTRVGGKERTGEL